MYIHFLILEDGFLPLCFMVYGKLKFDYRKTSLEEF